MVCSSRGTGKPTYEELTQTGVCKPLKTERGMKPQPQCVSTNGTNASGLRSPDVNVYHVHSAGFRFAIAALAALLA
jgi:hypothetical protein